MKDFEVLGLMEREHDGAIYEIGHNVPGKI